MFMTEEAYWEAQDEALYEMNARYDDIRERYGDTGDCGPDDDYDFDNIVGGVTTYQAAMAFARALFALACAMEKDAWVYDRASLGDDYIPF